MIYFVAGLEREPPTVDYEQSLFFLFGLPPSFLACRGFAARHTLAHEYTALTKSEEKDGLFAV